MKRLVLIGGGHSHVEVLRRFALAPPGGVAVTLVSRDALTPYSGMLPGFIAGHYDFADVHIDLVPLAAAAGAEVAVDEVVSLDLAGRRARCRSGAELAYDVVSIDIGSAPNTASVPGAAEHAVPVKPIGRFIARWQALQRRVAGHEGALRIGVVGAGAGGVELLLNVQYRLGRLVRERGGDPGRLDFHLVSDGGEVLHEHNRRTRRLFAEVLAARGVALHLGHRVTRVEAGALHCANGAVIALDEILWVTAAGAPAWPRECGLAVDAGGFIEVDAALRSTSHAEVYAAGDIARVVPHPRPKAGVFAVRQGPPLTANLRRALAGEAPLPFTPQRAFLTIITTGGKDAVASRGGWALRGRAMWLWKDWLDRRFMNRYRHLRRRGM